MPNFRRFLSRRWLAFLGGAALLFGLAMLHPYPRQSLFGPKIRGQPWCVWERQVRGFVDAQDSFSDKALRWLGVERQQLAGNEIFDDAEMLPLVLELLDDPDSRVRMQFKDKG